MVPPILFCIFNRPDLTEKSFERIRGARPSKLFISADGPRKNREGEADLCQAARSIARKVDWPCQVFTLFRDENIGCRGAMRSGITWFFEHVPNGIILEDDCVAEPCFFRFCEALLSRYERDQRVMCITGNNFQNGLQRGNASYYFSMFPHCWGWATWRRAWNLYDDNMQALEEITETDLLASLVGTSETAWLEAFEMVKGGELDSWAYRWLLSCWSESGLTATPNVNLVSNVGFDGRGTHTHATPPYAVQSSHDIGDIIHPEHVQRCCIADNLVLETVFGRALSPTNRSCATAILRSVRNKIIASLFRLCSA